MLIEAFSEAKDPSAPQTNEDRFAILPGRAYAVIDGVTDRLGTRYNGMLSGQYAATIVKGALEYAVARHDGPASTEALIAALTQAIADAYLAHGILEAARTDWNRRFSATLALALVGEEAIDITLVGDSGIRINGSRILQVNKDLDVITSTLRQEAWPVIGAHTDDPLVREEASRRITWFGTRQPPEALAEVLSPEDIEKIERLPSLQTGRRCRTCPSRKSKHSFAAESSTRKAPIRTTQAQFLATRPSMGSTFPRHSCSSSGCPGSKFGSSNFSQMDISNPERNLALRLGSRRFGRSSGTTPPR